MKESGECPKCNGDGIEAMPLRPDVAVEFGTYYLGDTVSPKLYVCLSCGFSEIWIDSAKDLDDIRKYAAARQKSSTTA